MNKSKKALLIVFCFILIPNIFSLDLPGDKIIGTWKMFPEKSEINIGSWFGYIAVQRSKEHQEHYEMILGMLEHGIGDCGSIFLFYDPRYKEYLFYKIGHLGPAVYYGYISIKSDKQMVMELHQGGEESNEFKFSTIVYEKESDTVPANISIWP